MPSHVYLIRHGEVDAAWRGRIYGALDVPLSEAGRRESERVAARLSSLDLSAVVSSGLTRAEFAAALLRTPRGLSALQDSELRELERGDWSGLHLDELDSRSPGAWEAWFAAPGESRAPGGESLADLQRRVLPRIRYWADLHPGGSIALVVHGWVIRTTICHLLGVPLDLAPRLDVRTGDILHLRWPTLEEPGVPRLEGFALDTLENQFSE